MNTNEWNEGDVAQQAFANEQDKHEIERDHYWGKVLTGNVATVPQDVREASGFALPANDDEEERVAGSIVRSWVVDHTPHTREDVMSNWGEIRREMSENMKAGESDRELFYALSAKAQTKRKDRQQLESLYGKAYEQALQSSDGADEEQLRNWKSTLPEALQDAADTVIRRGLHEGGDDRRRLASSAENVWMGMKSFMRYEGKDVDEEEKDEGMLAKLAYNPLMRALWHTPDMGKATEALQVLSEEDRAKVYSMLAPRMKERGSLEEGITRSINRGLMNTAYNVYLAKMNSDALFLMNRKDSFGVSLPGLGEKLEKDGMAIAEKARLFNELRTVTQEGMFPVHIRDARWIDDMLVDGAYAAAPAALAFTGGTGIGLLSVAETGRHMGDARVMNPDGDYSAQMQGAVGSGIASALLSLGMTKLGQKVAESAFRTFKSVRGTSSLTGGLRTLGAGGTHLSADTGMMIAENKLQEVVQYGGQEAAALASDQESGVPWEEWKERNLSPEAQIKEAATMFPYILLGAGKLGLQHFRNPNALMDNRKALRMLDVQEKIAEKIRGETNVQAQTVMLKHALESRPVWGTVFLGKKAHEWARLLENPNHPLFSSVEEVRDFMDMAPSTVEKPWKPEGKLAEAWYDSHQSPDGVMAAQVARDRWTMRAGLPDVVSGLNRKDYLPSADERSLTDWFRRELENEQRNLSIINASMESSVVPPALREGGGYHPDLQKARLAFLNQQTKSLVKNAYRLLLLKYPDPDSSPDSAIRTPEEWDACTEKMNTLLKTIVFDGALQFADGESASRVDHDLTWKFWRSWLEEASPGQTQEAMTWLEEIQRKCPPEYRRKLGVLEGVDTSVQLSGEQLADYLIRAEDWAASVPSVVREMMPERWKSLNRVSWSLKAQARTLREVIPGLHDFDLTVARGKLPRDGFMDLAFRELQLEPDKVQQDYMSSSIAPGKEKMNLYNHYAFMRPALDYLEILSPGSIMSTTGADKRKYWRVKYPDGNLSPWHIEMANATRDLAAHLAIMFSPTGGSKWDMSRQWAHFAVEEGKVFRMDDFNVIRLKDLTVKGSLYEQLTAHTVAELVEAGYGHRSFRSPGEKIIIAPENMGTRTDVLSKSLEKVRKEVYRKYVGPVRDMGCAAANGMGFGADGILWNNIVLYDHFSPLAMIEDKAEVVWSRLLATGQLPVDEGCRLLVQCGRTVIPEAEFARNAHLLVEELSQLSKEYYMANMDHASVPKSVPMWIKYTAMRPFPVKNEMETLAASIEKLASVPDNKLTPSQKAKLQRWALAMDTEEIRRLTESSKKRDWEKEKIPAFFANMIADSTGMNNFVRSERIWAMDGMSSNSLLNVLAEGYRDVTGREFHYYPTMERYVHAVHDNRLADILPEHILNDLVERINELPSLPKKMIKRRLLHSEMLMQNLSTQLILHPELAFWKSRSDGTYANLKALGDAEASFPKLEPGGWNTPVRGKKVTSGYGPRVAKDYTLEVTTSLPWWMRKSMPIMSAFHTLELIREDFANRPIPTSGGIVWRDRLFHPVGEARPDGVSPDWESRPLFGDLPVHGSKLPAGAMIGGVEVPDVGSLTVSLLNESLGNMCLFRDPQDARHTVRLMPGIPHSPLPEARAPFVVHQYHGVFLDRDGNPVLPENMGRSYIPLECFRGPEMDISVNRADMDILSNTVFHHYLEELGDISLHQRRWWNPGEGNSSYQEAVIRLHEELGVGRSVEQGRMAVDDPRYIQMLRMIMPLIHKPGYLYSFDQCEGSNHQSAIEEGLTLRQLFLDNPLNMQR